MNIRRMSTSITLTNQEDKIFLIFKGFSNDDSKKNNMIEVADVLENPIVRNFLNTNIRRIRYVKSFIGDNKYKECIELENSGKSTLNIISDDVNKHFSSLLKYINDNRTKIYEKYLFELMCKYNIDEIVFKLSGNGISSSIELVESNEKNKYKLIYSIPYTKDKKNKIIINELDVKLMQNTINNYFGISGCEYRGIHYEAPLGYLLKFSLLTDKANIIIDNNSIYKELELYLGMLMNEFEVENLKKRHEDFFKYQDEINKPKLYILKKEKNNGE